MAPEVAAPPHRTITTSSKPQHQPPHQSSNINPTKGDVYAAALVLWFLLYRRHPLGEYAGQGRHELAAKVRAKTQTSELFFFFLNVCEPGMVPTYHSTLG